MSDTPKNTSKENNTQPPRGSTFVLSREEFDKIPSYRGRYILLYILIFIWWLVPKVFFFVTDEIPPGELEFIYKVILAGLYTPFFYYYFKAMKTLGYPIYWILPTLMVVSIPIPGILAMGYMDRKIADTWDKADDAHQKYRQKVIADDEE